jgi:hypothetical protein
MVLFNFRVPFLFQVRAVGIEIHLKAAFKAYRYTVNFYQIYMHFF